MHFEFTEPVLQAVESTGADTWCLPVASDERPLRGLAGLVDWRLCGYVSGLIARGIVRGGAGEVTLLPGRPRLAADRLVFVGTGASDALDREVARRALEAALAASAGVGARAVVLGLPGRAAARVDPTDALEALLDALRGAPAPGRLFVAETAEARRAMERTLETVRRRARAARGSDPAPGGLP